MERLRGAFAGALGKNNVVDLKPIMVSEDFGLFGLEGHQIPLVLFLLGYFAVMKWVLPRFGVPT